MKKILSLLGTITLIGTSTTSLVACDNIVEYKPEELEKLKEENKINTVNQEIRDNLEWIAPQEKPFNKVDDKWYFIVWKSENWNIARYNNNNIKNLKNGVIIKDLNNSEYRLMIRPDGILGSFYKTWKEWNKDDGSYFKAVYRWNLDNNIPELVLDENNNVKVSEE
ncbi:lipoprotein [Spiroplasma endosymbiont of Phyllotreta cruciferae]|uniref:lipoprotein n=1 Tax=Spiroplasma endosymbiont of Phyllotreta cruciferae TaxID=2886375 RepID=UPI00209CB7D8|nr:lipoprotein [Spiroplasma endosymbiont of Phyllotreta cruciferae]